MRKSNIDEFNNKLKQKGIKCILVGQYVNVNIETEFYCEEHDHIFVAKPKIILRGDKSCPKCTNKIKQHTKESFSLALKEKKIPYILYGQYKKSNIETEFYCEEHDHIFVAKPKYILCGDTRCPKCTNKIKQHTKESFNNLLKIRNINYECLIYNGATKKSVFYCREHCCQFDAYSSHILSESIRCPMCSGYNRWDNISINEFLEKQGRQIIFIDDFLTTKDIVSFQCVKCGYIWKTNFNSVYNGTGCPNCTKGGFNPEKPAYLYYIKILYAGLYYYKIGITNRCVGERFSNVDLNKIQNILFEDYYEFGLDAYNKEQEILKEFNEYRYNGEPILNSGGNTEIFIQDVFNGNYNI